MNTTPVGNGVTTRDVVLRLADKIDHVAEDVSEIRGLLPGLLEAISDHERRIVPLERLRYALPSAAALSVLISFGVLLHFLF